MPITEPNLRAVVTTSEETVAVSTIVGRLTASIANNDFDKARTILDFEKLEPKDSIFVALETAEDLLNKRKQHV